MNEHERRNLWLLAFLVLPIAFATAAVLTGARARRHVRPACVPAPVAPEPPK